MTRKNALLYLSLIALLIAADQGTKSFLISYLKTQPNYMREVCPFFNLVYAWNYGISFGLFQEYYAYSNIIFLSLNSCIIFYLAYILYNAESFAAKIGMIFIIGGAFGNLFDRVFRGAVFDFLYFHYDDFSFPAFNLADSFISIGAFFFIYDYVARSQGNQAEPLKKGIESKFDDDLEK